jgi:hypothetical protein
MTPPITEPHPTKLQQTLTDAVLRMKNQLNGHLESALSRMEAKANQVTEGLLDFLSSHNIAGTSRNQSKRHLIPWNAYPRPSRRPKKFNRKRPSTLPAPSCNSPQHLAPKVSHMSNDKWQTQARQFITNWTPRHMDAYLAIPEVALEWNVDPG